MSLILQSGKNGPKDKAKKRCAPSDEPECLTEKSGIAGTLDHGAAKIERGEPWTDPSNDVVNELCVAPYNSFPTFQDDVDHTIQSILATPGLGEHRYICLMEYSVLRAFIQSASLLAIDPTLIANDDALSPWTTANPYPSLAPYDLCPTLLQLSTPHHPYLDMISPSSLRDNVLLFVMTDEQEDQLCTDMHSGSFTIWGSQPWNALGM